MTDYVTWAISSARTSLSFEADSDETAVRKALAWMERKDVFDACLRTDGNPGRFLPNLTRQRPVEKLRVVVRCPLQVEFSFVVSGEGPEDRVRSAALTAARDAMRKIRKLIEYAPGAGRVNTDCDIEGVLKVDGTPEEYASSGMIDLGVVKGPE